MSGDIEARKREHIDTVLGEDVSGKGVSTGFGRFFFEHAASPELDLGSIDLSTRFVRASPEGAAADQQHDGRHGSRAGHQP